MLAEYAGFAALLFVVRFLLRGHLVPEIDEECALGGVAVDLLAYGVRFPLAVYAPNNYENGFFYSGLVTAASFSVLGRNVLALKLPTHLIVSMGAVATLWLLRSCLDELRVSARQARVTAIAVLIIATAFSPRAIAFYSTAAAGIGSHPEGSAIDMVLLAVFARRRAGWSTKSTVGFWTAVGFALHVNKATLILVLVLAISELNRARSSPRLLVAACFGFLLGSAPALMTRSGTAAALGWENVASKVMEHARNFPSAFISTALTLGEYRPELLTTWALAITLAVALLYLIRRQSSVQDGGSHPSALRLTVGFLSLHLAALTVMAQGGVDYYAMHAYPPLVVATALLAGWACSAASKMTGVRRGRWVGAMLVAWMMLAHRAETLRPGFTRSSELWRNRGGAACSWRFAEAFLRLPGGGVDKSAVAPAISEESLPARERRAIVLCRSLSEQPQILDCIGGIARDFQYGGGRIHGEPPASLSDVERRAFAFYYGVRRFGRMGQCDDFLDSALRKDCRTAVQLDCFNLADAATRYVSGDALGRPHCEISRPPMDGYYAEMRLDLLARPTGSSPRYGREFTEQSSMGACMTLVDACY